MTVLYLVGFLTTVIYYGVTSIKIFTISLLVLLFPISLFYFLSYSPVNLLLVQDLYM